MPKQARESDARWDRELATRTEDERATAILNLLELGPLMKWRLRERLHEPESVIDKTLVRLRAAYRIKSVMLGKQGVNNRGWALVAWTRPVHVALVPVPRIVKPKAPVSTDSFWLNLPRERFTAACQARSR